MLFLLTDCNQIMIRFFHNFSLFFLIKLYYFMEKGEILSQFKSIEAYISNIYIYLFLSVECNTKHSSSDAQDVG